MIIVRLRAYRMASSVPVWTLSYNVRTLTANRATGVDPCQALCLSELFVGGPVLVLNAGTLKLRFQMRMKMGVPFARAASR